MSFDFIDIEKMTYRPPLTQGRSHGIIWEFFSNMGGWWGLPNSQNFCKFTKYSFLCQIHYEVLKHVLQRGGGDI